MRLPLTSLLLGLVLCLGAVEPLPTPITSVHLRESRMVEAEQLERVESVALRLLASAQFNTLANAEALRQPVPKIHERYRETLAGDYVLLRFEKPTTIHTMAGDTTVYDLVVGIGPQCANAVFTVDESGRLIAHEKYAGDIAIELREAVMSGK